MAPPPSSTVFQADCGPVRIFSIRTKATGEVQGHKAVATHAPTATEPVEASPPLPRSLLATLAVEARRQVRARAPSAFDTFSESEEIAVVRLFADAFVSSVRDPDCHDWAAEGGEIWAALHASCSLITTDGRRWGPGRQAVAQRLHRATQQLLQAASASLGARGTGREGRRGRGGRGLGGDRTRSAGDREKLDRERVQVLGSGQEKATDSACSLTHFRPREGGARARESDGRDVPRWQSVSRQVRIGEWSV